MFEIIHLTTIKTVIGHIVRILYPTLNCKVIKYNHGVYSINNFKRIIKI